MSEKNPLFSVVMQAYNSENFIRKALDSVRNQSFTDYEMIVACDKCVDNTKEVAREYTDKVYEVDHDVSGPARNKGLDEATGDWILFLDDDDWYLPGAFEKIAEELKRQPDIDILAYGFEWRLMGEAYQSKSRIYPAIWNKAWKRSFIGETRFPGPCLTEDLSFARILHPKARFGYLYEVLYYYNFMRPGSVSEKLRNGEYDNKFREEEKADAVNYRNWLKSKEFNT